jgi:hypothetical protein
MTDSCLPQKHRTTMLASLPSLMLNIATQRTYYIINFIKTTKLRIYTNHQGESPLGIRIYAASPLGFSSWIMDLYIYIYISARSYVSTN